MAKGVNSRVKCGASDGHLYHAKKNIHPMGRTCTTNWSANRFLSLAIQPADVMAMNQRTIIIKPGVA
jgi:hypothetical protein